MKMSNLVTTSNRDHLAPSDLASEVPKVPSLRL